MKLNTIIIVVMAWIILLTSPLSKLYSQGKVIVMEVRELPVFTGIEVGGAFSVYLEQGEKQSVIVETNENFLPKVITSVENGILKVSSKSISDPSRLNLYITLRDLETISVSGAADVESKGLINTEKLHIESSGASSLELALNAQEVDVSSSGASDVVLAGNTGTLNARASGASSIDCENLAAADARAEASGAADIQLSATSMISTQTSGAGTIRYDKKNKTVIIKEEPSGKEYITIDSKTGGDTTRVKVGGVYVEVVEDDSVKVTIGNRVLIVSEDGDVRIERCKKRKFNGHWGGFGLSINGYVNRDYNMDFPEGDEYLDLRMEKSIGVYFNLIEQNIALTRNKKFGIVTGLGIETHNYRFLHPTTLYAWSSELEGYIDVGISVRKSKLVANYFVVPVILEWQTNQDSKWKRFHINGGVVLKARFASHTKKYYDELNKQYYLSQYDPELGDYIPLYETVSPGVNITHNKGDYYLNPFQLDATAGIGIGAINLFGQFGLLPMFRENKAPELFTWSAGIILAGW